MKDLFNTFAPGLVPYRVKNSIFFHPPVNKHGVGMVMPNVDWIDGKPILNGVIIPRRIDITYDYYKKLCKAFAKLNIRKYRLKTESNPDKQSFFINLLDEKIKVDWKEIEDFVDVLIADKGISSRKSRKILKNVFLFLHLSINQEDIESKQIEEE